MTKASSNDLFEKRKILIIDYISQILVYGSNTPGIISFNTHAFDDGKYMIMTVSVVKNSYFRWHDLGIKSVDSLKFYKFIFNSIVEKFEKFNITLSDNKVVIKSDVNNNTISVSFSLTKKSEKTWFDKIKCQL